jgi:DNA-binding response OmpR family regulator
VSDARPIAKVLIVDADPAKLQALTTALTTAAFLVTSATSASFALTTLERDRPDLIVSGNRTEDMDGVEFCSIIRSDPVIHNIPFLLLSGPTRPTPWAVAQAGVDMLVAGDFVVSTVLDRILKLLRHVAPQAEPGLPTPAPPLPPRVTVPRAEAGTRTFEGSFGVLDLTEVTQAIALGGKTGRLSLQLAAGEGSLFFDSGRVVHAEFASRTGESAFAAMVSAAQSDPEGTFRFKPAAELPAGAGPRTIQKSVDQLLLSIASEIDEGRAAAGAPPPPPRT